MGNLGRLTQVGLQQPLFRFSHQLGASFQCQCSVSVFGFSDNECPFFVQHERSVSWFDVSVKNQRQCLGSVSTFSVSAWVQCQCSVSWFNVSVQVQCTLHSTSEDL